MDIQRTFSLFLLLMPLSWASCDKPLFSIKKDPPSLPPITTTGENTFGCLVNGEFWLKNTQFLHGGITGEYHSGYDIFQIHGHRFREGDLQASISFSAYLTEEGEHELHHATYWDSDSTCIGSIVREGFELLLEGASNKVNILNLDQKEFIVSGTFEFTLVYPECGDTIRVTDGRFDYDYAN